MSKIPPDAQAIIDKMASDDIVELRITFEGVGSVAYGAGKAELIAFFGNVEGFTPWPAQ